MSISGGQLSNAHVQNAGQRYDPLGNFASISNIPYLKGVVQDTKPTPMFDLISN